MRELETVEGIGEVFRENTGALVGRMRYRLLVSQAMIDAGHRPARPGMKDVHGYVDPIDANASPIGQLMGVDLVLILEDGRRFKFLFQSTDGTIAPRGGLEQPEKGGT